MEQFLRDARIAQIYEGTNGIQALDQVRRKLFIHDGRLPKRFFSLLEQFIVEHQGNEALTPFITPLGDANNLLQELTEWIINHSRENPDELGAAATDYLRVFALTTFAWLWARMAVVALDKLDDDPDGFYQSKIKTARFFMGRLLPQIHGLSIGIHSGADLLMDYAENEF